MAGLVAPVLAAGVSLVPVAGVVAGAAGLTAASAVAASPASAAPAKAAVSGSVLILSTSVNGGTSSAEAQAASAAGYSVTVDTPTEWDALSKAGFQAYSAIIIGDPSSGGSCSSTVPSDALSTASTWGAAIDGNVAVLGTAPALAGSNGASSLIQDAIAYAAQQPSSGSGVTGLYVSLNCDYSASSESDADAGLLDDVYGGGFDVTGLNSSGPSCSDGGTVNTWEADSSGAFAGLGSSALSGVNWGSPACAVQETFSAWPSDFTPVAYDTSAAPADFTASDGTTGQPYVLLGTPPAASSTTALAPSAGGEVPAGTTSGSVSNAAAAGVDQGTAGDPVNTENGDFTQSDTDVSIPTFGPGLDFTRTYDAQLAQQQTRAAAPGPMGYGWTDNWATSLATSQATPGDIYTIGGLGTATGQAGPPAQAAVNNPGAVYVHGADVYYADTLGNRIEEVPGESGTQWGITMSAGDVYTIAGSDTGTAGASPSGTADTSSLLDQPSGLTMDSAGDLYIADTGNDRVAEIPDATRTLQWGGNLGTMTQNDLYVIAGRTGQAAVGDDAKQAIQSDLDQPMGLHMGAGSSPDLYIADTGNNRVQEIAGGSGESEWGQGTLTEGDVYTVAGSPSGTSGTSNGTGAATTGFLTDPQSVTISGAGDMYIADSLNDRIQEVPASAGTQWGTISMTAFDMYTVAGRTGQGAVGDDGKVATQSDLNDPTAVRDTNGGNLYIADSGNQRIQEVADTGHTEFGQAMTADFVYTIAGDSAGGTGGYSGNGGAATSAQLERPTDVFLDGSNNLYIADTGNNEIREVSATTADISGFAGGAGMFGQDGDGGTAVDAGLSSPYGIASDAHGDIFIADTGSNRVQEIAAWTHTQFKISMTAGDVYTVAGQQGGYPGISGDDSQATSGYLNLPTSVAVDPAGNLFIADSFNNRIQEVSAATGIMSTFAGSAAGTKGDSGNGVAATSAKLNTPYAVATDSAGDVFIAGNATNIVQEVPAATGNGMTAGDIYTIAGNGSAGPGPDGVPATSSSLQGPEGVAVDAAGNVYISDYLDSRIQEVPAANGTQWGQQMTAGDIYTVAGSAAGSSGHGGDGGPATKALLTGPGQIATDAAGDLYITDAGNNRIREVAAANGTQWGQQMKAGYIYTVAGDGSGGTPGSDTGDGGPATSAEVNGPVGIGTDPQGDLFITDSLSNHLREVTATPNPLYTTSTPNLLTAITITQPDATQVTFYPQTSGTCPRPEVTAGQYCVMPANQGATLTYNTGTEDYTYSPSPGATTYAYAWNGALVSESDTAGDTLNITYDSPAPGASTPAPYSVPCPSSATSCNTITSASGRPLVIGTNGSGQVTSVTDPMGREWTYTYNNTADLTAATDPTGQQAGQGPLNQTTYTYGAGTSGNPLNASDLLTITSPNAQPNGPDAGDDTVNTYNAAGQITTQTDPMGYTTTFSYCASATAGDCMNPATGNGVVTVTDPDGNKTAYTYDQGTLAAQANWTGTTLTSETDNIPDTTTGTLLDTSTFNGNQNQTSYKYDTAGDPTQTSAPSGTGSQPAITTAQYTGLGNDSCDGTAQTATPCSASENGPTPVAPGGVITPPTAAPPAGVTYTLYDTNGNELYTTTGVYQPGSSSASYQQTTYQLFNGNSVTLNSTNTTCANNAPSASLPCATINADGVVTQLTYDSAGDLTGSSTPDGNGSQQADTTHSYNNDGEQTSTTAPDGNLTGANTGNYTTVTTYNANGQKTTVTQAGGTGATVTPRTTTYGYDADNNQTTAQDARGYTTTTTYNADNQATLVTHPDNNATLTCYDGDGNIAQTVTPRGVAASNLSASSCPTSYPSGYSDRLAAESTVDTYDIDGNITTETAPAPAGQSGSETTTYTYDSDDNLLKTTSPPSSNGGQDQVTVDTYNSADELAAQTTGYGTTSASTTTYCYNPDGDQTSVIMPDGNTGGIATCETSSPWVVSSSAHPTQASYQTTASYDSADELVSTTSPATAAAPSGATTTYTYDPAGNKLTSTDPNKITTTWTYTPGNQPATRTYSGSSAHSVTYGYDADGNQTSMSDATGSSSYTYNPFGELASATNGASQTVGYSYDADGDTTSVTYPLPAAATWATSDTATYGYNKADILNSVTDFNGNQISITNNGDSLPTSESLGSSGDTLATTYDSTDAPSTITLKNSATTLQSFSYSDAPDSSILTETDTPSSSQSPATYTYDGQSRLASMTSGTGPTTDYSFDASGNLTTLPTGATAQYNDASQLTSSTLSGTTTTYTYNSDGQRLTATQGSTVTESGTWNGAAELTAYSDAAASLTAATYDGTGLRATAAYGTSAQNFVWDTTTQVPEILMDSDNAYIYADGNTPAEQISLSSGTVTYLVSDSLGSVRGTVSSNGALTDTTSYDAWGNPETSSGLTSTTPFGFAGGYTDPTDLIYLINRYYDPSIGQFISIDPLVSQTNQPYQYTNGDPITGTDPTGQLALYEVPLRHKCGRQFCTWGRRNCVRDEHRCSINWWLTFVNEFRRAWIYHLTWVMDIDYTSNVKSGKYGHGEPGYYWFHGVALNPLPNRRRGVYSCLGIFLCHAGPTSLVQIYFGSVIGLHGQKQDWYGYRYYD